MTKKQKEKALAFMYENEVELVVAPYGVYYSSACQLCYYNEIGDCPGVDGNLLCSLLNRDYFKTFFRRIPKYATI